MSKCSTPKFTRLSGDQLSRSFASSLIPVADTIRDLYTQFGLRNYQVSIIVTGWTSGRRGIGEEYVKRELEILPTPLVQGLDAVMESLNSIGLVEEGTASLSEISGRYTEEQLLGRFDGVLDIQQDEQVFYEIHFPLKDGNPGVRRRFAAKTAPYYSASLFAWSVSLERSRPDRKKNGDLR